MRTPKVLLGWATALTLALGAQAALADVIATGSYDWSGTDPTASARIRRLGATAASDWGSPQPFPGIYVGPGDTGPFDYTTFSFNSGIYSYLQITLLNLHPGATGEGNLFPAVYTTALDPANLSLGAGWVGSAGTSTGLPGVPVIFRVDATTNTNYLLFVEDTNSETLGPNGAFSYTIEGFTSATAVPLPPGIWLLASGLAGLWMVRRRAAISI